MHILVLGGDGFCGWPTALHLSAAGHSVTIVDNLSRRKIDIELEVSSLTPIQPISERLKLWRDQTTQTIGFEQIDVAHEYDRLLRLIRDTRPDALVHFAEQRAAPYSMKTFATRRYTVDNNLNATHNVLAAITESGHDVHLVHLGTMGVYGYGTAGMDLPEGYIDVEMISDGQRSPAQRILYPTNPGSIYHMTKSQDQIFFAYYAKNQGTRITDLHQGIVWGTNTSETKRHEGLINRFDYDGDYGTVLNRFLMQAAIGYPLTVHGTGGQTRAFIHIQDTVRCVELAVGSPPDRGAPVRILNQMTETHRVAELAEMISQRTGVEIAYLPNPRNEAAENDLLVKNNGLIGLGLEPTLLEHGLLEEVMEIAGKYQDSVDRRRIPCVSTW